MLRDIQEIQALATKYSKQQLAQMAQMGMLDPTKAVMAGMMIKRIEEQNQKPPQTTVAQDVLSTPQQMPMQGQQQPPQQPQQAPQQPPEMVQAPAGIEGLPAGEVGNYAGGGIVAFGEGGLNDNEYYGLPIGGSGRSGSEGYWSRPVMPYGEQMRNVGNSIINGLRRIIQDPAMDEKDRAEAKAKLNALSAEPPVSSAYPDESRRGSASFTNPFNTPNNPALPPIPSGRRDAPPPTLTSGKPIAPPTIGAFDPNAIKLENTPLPEYKERDVKEIGDLRRKAEIAEGVDPKLHEKLIKKIEEKEAALEGQKEEAKGHALMQFGLGLLGARRGQEWEKAGESGTKALSGLNTAMKEFRDASDKNMERIQALQISEQEAKRTGARSDVAQAESDRKAAFDSKVKKAEAANDLVKAQAQVGAQVRGQDVQAATSTYTAQLSSQTQKEIARLSADTQRWVASRPPAEILAIEEVAKRTGKPFDQAMKDFYGSRFGARNVLTDEDVLKMATKNLSDRAIVNPTQQQIQQEAAIIKQAYAGIQNGAVGGGGSLQQGANGSFNYVPRQ